MHVLTHGHAWLTHGLSGMPSCICWPTGMHMPTHGLSGMPSCICWSTGCYACLHASADPRAVRHAFMHMLCQSPLQMSIVVALTATLAKWTSAAASAPTSSTTPYRPLMGPSQGRAWQATCLGLL